EPGPPVDPGVEALVLVDVVADDTLTGLCHPPRDSERHPQVELVDLPTATGNEQAEALRVVVEQPHAACLDVEELDDDVENDGHPFRRIDRGRESAADDHQVVNPAITQLGWLARGSSHRSGP